MYNQLRDKGSIMTEQTTAPRRLHVILLTIFASMALVARLLPGARIVDDAFITFRYARNIVNGLGFVYNPGERVLGTTTPLYTLILAALSLATGSQDFPSIAFMLNAVAGTASVGMLYLLGVQISDHWAPAAAAAALWALAPYSVTFATGGMETELCIMLLLACTYAHITRRCCWLSILSAMALLTRPDTAILLGLLWFDELLIRRGIPWRQAILAIALMLPWILFGTLYYGSPLPGSIAAKSATYRLPPEAGLVRLVQHYSTPAFEHNLLGPRWQLLGSFVYLAICAFGGLHTVKQNTRSWPIFLYPYVYLIVFAAANPLIFRWYLSPPLPFYLLSITTSLWVLLHLLSTALVRRPSIRIQETIANVTFVVLTAAAGFSTLNSWTIHPDHGLDRPAPDMAWYELELLYNRAADILLEITSPDDSLCAGDIGVLGYRTGLHIIDTVGLVTPAARDYYPADTSLYAINYAIPPDLILDLAPDKIVILEVYGRLGLIPNPQFKMQYELTHKLDTDIYGSDGMLIFSRR